MSCYWKKEWFDNLDPENPINFDPNFSDPDPNYNCIGWAIDPEIPKNWWPAGPPNYRWPKSLLFDKRPTLENFLKAFSTQGYLPCADGSLEEGYEKVVLYAMTDHFGNPSIKHAARQLPDGKWTSKFGECEDVTHFTVEDINGSLYGQVAQFLKRKRKFA